MGGTPSIINGYVTPRTTGKAVVPEDLYKLVAQMVFGDVMYFTSVADRTTKLAKLLAAGLGAPPAGARCYLSTLKRDERFDGTNWYVLPGTEVFGGRQTAAQSIANSSWTSVTLDTEDRDLYNGHSVAVDTSRFTPGYVGRFQVVLAGGFVSNVTGARGMGLGLNGALVRRSLMNAVSSGGLDSPMTAVFPITINSIADYLELMLLQVSGGALNTASASADEQASMSVIYLGSGS